MILKKTALQREIGSLPMQKVCIISETRIELCKKVFKIRLYNQKVYDQRTGRTIGVSVVSSLWKVKYYYYQIPFYKTPRPR